MENGTRYLTLRQRLWWLVGVASLFFGGIVVLKILHANNVAGIITFLVLFSVAAFASFVWWSRRVGELMPREERQRRYARELLARPFWALVLMFVPGYAVYPVVPFLFDEPIDAAAVLLCMPIALVAALVMATVSRWQAQRQLLAQQS